MSEDPNVPPLNPPELPGNRIIALAVASDELERRRKALVWQLAGLLAATVAAFALTTWVLVRIDTTWGQAKDASPANIVRAQLEALDRGELREAYDLFSQQYRDRVPFRAFHELVAAHPAMFRARHIVFGHREESSARAILDTRIVAADGERYVARYTLIVIEGHWWIDDLRWGHEAESRGRLSARAGISKELPLALAIHFADSDKGERHDE